MGQGIFSFQAPNHGPQTWAGLGGPRLGVQVRFCSVVGAFGPQDYGPILGAHVSNLVGLRLSWVKGLGFGAEGLGVEGRIVTKIAVSCMRVYRET